MVANTPLGKVGRVKESRSDFHHDEMRTAEAGKVEKCCFNVRRRWRTTKVHTELISGDGFHRKTEAEIGERHEPGWQTIRRRRRTKAEGGRDTDDASLRDSDSSVNVFRCDSLCRVVGRRKRQRTDLKKTNGERGKNTRRKTRSMKRKNMTKGKERRCWNTRCVPSLGT